MEKYAKYIGKVLDNRYTIKRHIGSGGMSYVFLAADGVMKRDVAIKLLKDELMSDADAIERFVIEAKAVSMMDHQNIVRCYDVSNGESLKYIVMEYISGETLKEYLKRKQVLPPSEAINYTCQILSALEYAHSKGIIHRDIKPQNVLLVGNGEVKVSDFGIAQLPSNEPLQISATTIGTVDYISPEQARGKEIDRRSDLYSVGILLYEAVTGRLPFISDDFLTVAKMQINETPTPPTAINQSIPKGLEQVILKAISKNPDDRFESARQMLDCLDRLSTNPSAVFDFVTFVPDPVENGEKPVQDLLFSSVDSSEERNIAFQTVTVGNNKTKKRPVVSYPRRRKKKTPVLVEKVYLTKPARVSILSITLGVFVAVALVALTTALYAYETYFSSIIDTSSNSEVIVVSDFSGQLYNDDLKARLEEEGYDVSIEWVSDADYIYGSVVSQYPKKNTHRTVASGKKCELTLTLSAGEDMVTLDNYVGLEYRQASILMNNLGLNYQIVKIYNDTMEQGLIISTYPAGGISITPETEITVYVSKGADISYTTVPNLVGLTVSQVSTAIQNANLSIGKITYQHSNSVSSGLVISQSSNAGALVPSGLTRIDLVISLGP
jgi:serine/threonine-protein kinase